MIQLLKPIRLSARLSVGLFILRLVAGSAFMHHGYGKIQNPFGWMGPDSAVPLHDPFVSQTGGSSYEPALGYLCVAVLLLLAGPGRFALDRIIFGDRAPDALRPEPHA